MKKLLLAAAIGASVIVTNVAFAFVPPCSKSVSCTEVKTFVSRVVDGDTYVIDEVTTRGNTKKVRRFKVRLYGVDTPEIWHPKCQEEHKLALLAKFFVRNLLQGKEVVLNTVNKDRYGRVVADVYLLAIGPNNEKYMANVGDLLVYNKYAKYWDYPKQKKPSFCEK